MWSCTVSRPRDDTQVSNDWEDDPQQQESRCEQVVLEQGYEEVDDER